MYIFGAIKTCYRSLESTEFQIHKVSSLLPLYLKSSFVSFEVNLAFVSPQIHFQCQIFNINIVSSFFLIVFELFLNKRVNVWSSLVYRQLQTVLYPNLKLFLQRVVLLLNFNLNSVWIWINLLFLLQLLQQLTEQTTNECSAPISHDQPHYSTYFLSTYSYLASFQVGVTQAKG